MAMSDRRTTKRSVGLTQLEFDAVIAAVEFERCLPSRIGQRRMKGSCCWQCFVPSGVTDNNRGCVTTPSNTLVMQDYSRQSNTT
jgi:hypothetical protein